MKDYLRFIKSAWEKFVATGCVKSAVNPNNRRGTLLQKASSMDMLCGSRPHENIPKNIKYNVQALLVQALLSDISQLNENNRSQNENSARKNPLKAGFLFWHGYCN